MHTTIEFAHGIHYGDYSGIYLGGPPDKGLWEGYLAVSQIYADPLFQAALDHFCQPPGLRDTPKLCSEYNTSSGWAEDGLVHQISDADARELALALSALDESDFRTELAGTTVEECLKCARAVSAFIQTLLDRGLPLFMERD